MKNYDKYLEDKQRSPLIDNLPKYQHIERMGHDAVDGILSGEVYIQTKIDGANLTVANTERGLVVCSRNMCVSIDGEPNHGFKGAIEYILENSALCEMSKKYIFRGEWLVRHTITYDKDKVNKFWVFDVQEYETFRYLTPEEYEPICKEINIGFVPILAKLNNPSIGQLIPYSEGGDIFGAKQKEGIVIKRYDFVNKFGRTNWGKIVTADFKEKAKLSFGARKHDPPEIRFVSKFLDDTIVIKVIDKIKQEKGEITIKDMPRILQTVWYDLFNEELWGFVSKSKVKEFNFDTACRLATKKTREIALAYFNGVLHG